MHENLESTIRLLAELASAFAALAVLVSKLSELDAQIRLNRELIRAHSKLLDQLTHNLKGFVCDRPDDRPVDERSLH